jgi:hypothetical protein
MKRIISLLLLLNVIAHSCYPMEQSDYFTSLGKEEEETKTQDTFEQKKSIPLIDETDRALLICILLEAYQFEEIDYDILESIAKLTAHFQEQDYKAIVDHAKKLADQDNSPIKPPHLYLATALHFKFQAKLPPDTLKSAILHYAKSFNVQLPNNTIEQLALYAKDFYKEEIEKIFKKAKVSARLNKVATITPEIIEKVTHFSQYTQDIVPTPEVSFSEFVTKVRVSTHKDFALAEDTEFSSGYHALKNGLFLLKAFTSPSDKITSLESLTDPRIAYSLVLSPNSSWRRFITEKYLPEALEDIIYNSLLLHILGKERYLFRKPAQGESFIYELRREKGWIKLSSLENTPYSNESRQALQSLLPKVAKRLSCKFSSALWQSNTDGRGELIISKSHVEEALQIELLSLIRLIKTAELNSLSIKTEEVKLRPSLINKYLEDYFPDFSCLRLSLNASSVNYIKEETSGQSISFNELHKNSLSDKELEALAEFEFNRPESQFSSLRNVIEKIIILKNRKQTKKDLEPLQQRIQDSYDSPILACIILPISQHWVACVLEKIPAQAPHYYIADSCDNKATSLDKELIELIRYLHKNGYQKSTLPSDRDTLALPLNPIQYNVSEPFPYEKHIPPLEQIFNGKVPRILKILIKVLENPLFTKGESANGLESGLLLYGPPGTGKNTIVQHLIKQSGRYVIYKSGGDFATKWKASSKENLKKLFEEALETVKKTELGVIIFIDEIDGIAKSSNGTQQAEDHDQVISYLKTAMNEHRDNPYIFVVAATNNKKILDPAIHNRFNTLLVDLPDQQARKLILTYYLYKHNTIIINDTGLIENIELSKTPDSKPFENLSSHLHSRSSSFYDRECRQISSAFLELLATVTEGFSARDLKRVVDLTILSHIFKFEYVVTPKNKNSFLSPLCYLFGLDSTLSQAILSASFIATDTEARYNLVRMANLDISPTAYVNSLKLMTLCVKKLLPMERYLYETTLEQMKELLSNDNKDYKEKAAKYLNVIKSFYSLAKDALSITNIVGGGITGTITKLL